MTMEESNGLDDEQKPRDAELPLKDMRNWQLIPSANESPVKSTAIVKYSAVQRAASFAELQCNTNLNLPPPNWLTSSAESYGLQHAPAHSTGFSSFRLAHMFPDCVGEVDIVSDAENIKKLLKIPYSTDAVSMMVHRIENTLLIDDFDVHKLLLQQSRSDWVWLREFLRAHVLQSMSIKDKSHRRSALQSRHLVSKFLHHSLAATNPPPSPPPLWEPSSKLPLSEPPLPEPQDTGELPNSRSHKFLRNVVWNFEDLQMLLGTDMPIFGGPAHPCISLRLCDMAKPISVLTGIDYWLDNLMSNVPEVVMCFHLDGIVKRYELLKTEDLPNSLPDSKFSPKVIRDVAQNILSFLKTNAAKAGHTYWLFKGKDDDVVKLYDLTSLCLDSVDEKDQNPFIVPVAMLLYRVARNMKHSAETQHKRSSIVVLLENCVRLLDAKKYPQIVTSAYYMLSDLFIPATIDPENPVFDDELDDDEKQEGNQNLTDVSYHNSLYKNTEGSTHVESSSSKPSTLIESSDSESDETNGKKHVETGTKDFQKNSLTSVMSLNLLNNESEPKRETDDYENSKFMKPPPLAASVPERCMLALMHVAIGLQNLQYFPQEEARKTNNSGKPIPMPWCPLNKIDKNEDRDEKQSKNIHTNKTEEKEERQPKNKKYKSKTVKGSGNVDRNDDYIKVLPNNIKELLCPMPYGCMPTWETPDKNDNVSWKAHLKILLYEKACLVYATLAEHAFSTQRFGWSLQMIGRMLRCWEVVDCLLRVTNQDVSRRLNLESYLLGKAGDCCFMMVQVWPQIHLHRSDLKSNTSTDAKIEHEILRDFPNLVSDGFNLIPTDLESIEGVLKSSLELYEKGLKMCPELVNFYRRIGNLHNELGVMYMGQAQSKYEEICKQMNMSHERMDPLVKQRFTSKFDLSLKHLENGLAAFDAAKDNANKALLHSNIGRLLRMCAHFYVPTSNNPREHYNHERSFYDRSVINYQTALEYLGQREGNEAIWDAVTWELSTAYYNLAVQALDNPSPHLLAQGNAEVERVSIDYLQRALKHCDTGTPGPKQLLYQLRLAMINHKLASLFHKKFRMISSRDDTHGTNERDERHGRALLQSSHIHYTKCLDMYISLEQPYEFFLALIEAVALEELIATNATSPVSKLKAINTCLEQLFHALPMLKIIASQDERKNADSSDPMFDSSKDEKICGLLKLYENRLQGNILLATKCSQCSRKDLSSLEPTYKSMYISSIRTGELPDETGKATVLLAKHLVSSVSNIENVWVAKVKKNTIS